MTQILDLGLVIYQNYCENFVLAEWPNMEINHLTLVLGYILFHHQISIVRKQQKKSLLKVSEIFTWRMKEIFS